MRQRWCFPAFGIPILAGLLLTWTAASAEGPGLPAIPVLQPPPKAEEQPLNPADQPKKDNKGLNGNGKPIAKDNEKENGPAWQSWQPPGRALTLGECLAIAASRRPAVVAAQLSLAATERGYLSLMKLNRVAELLSPDLPIRRHQAARGIAAATAEVRKALLESNYDTLRVYYEYVRATQQEQTATTIIDQLEVFIRVARNILETGVRDPRVKIDRFSLYALESGVDEIRDLRDKATNGRKRAIAALSEALALGPDDAVYPVATKLPIMGGSTTQEQVVAFALGNRSELVQTAVLVDVSRLEICAQNSISRQRSVPTFASGTDLHSRVLPAAIRNGEYRPGAVVPEMPSFLAGSREDRVARAVLYSKRMDEVYREAENLIRLESVNAYLIWKATAERLEQAEKRFERGKKIAEDARTAGGAGADYELLVRNIALAGKAQASYVEAVYEHLLALIALERVTAGQVQALFAER